jgi:hypothetical protein
MPAPPEVFDLVGWTVITQDRISALVHVLADIFHAVRVRRPTRETGARCGTGSWGRATGRRACKAHSRITYGTGAGACLTPLCDTFDMTTTCIGSTAGPGAEPGIRGGEAGNDMLVASTEHIPKTATAPMTYPFLDNRGRNAPRTKPDLRRISGFANWFGEVRQKFDRY